jgi:hypothetical protein
MTRGGERPLYDVRRQYGRESRSAHHPSSIADCAPTAGLMQAHLHPMQEVAGWRSLTGIGEEPGQTIVGFGHGAAS